MIKDMEVFRLNGEIVFAGVWDDESKGLQPPPNEWVKSIEPVEKLHDGTYLAVADYKARRVYPSIEDQLDYIYHHGVDSWREGMIKPIKDKNPK